ncbi:hypothetical protein C8R44DRAFT_895572 [Mycena epipterygia]|nr:hypothetical protein C8R44DRAFT_895572 [Mycena epipterygia]
MPKEPPGLRGPLVVYDPDDPHLDLYDVDDGWSVFTSTPICLPSDVRTETTVMTLADCTLGDVPTLISTSINALGMSNPRYLFIS